MNWTYEGMAIAESIATMARTVTTSTKVKPAARSGRREL
jgi:hypothetical protein